MQITQLLGIDFPIIQAPMVGVSTPQLAAAVSNAGALGSIGIGASSPAQAEAMIKQTRALTDRAFNVNVFCHQPAHLDPRREQLWLEHLRPLFAEFAAEPPASLHEIYRSFIDDPETLQVLLDTRPAVVSFHFGLPRQDWIDRLKARGIRLLATATSLHEARLIETAGLDAIVAQGAEAGGYDKKSSSTGSSTTTTTPASSTPAPSKSTASTSTSDSTSSSKAASSSGTSSSD
jgi:nitronate monooxygenase